MTAGGMVKSYRQQQTVKHSCSVTWLPDLGLLHHASCSCGHFTDRTYVCEHIVALCTAMLVQEHGEDVLRGTRLEQLLRESARV